jgi:hypothetical protein
MRHSSEWLAETVLPWNLSSARLASDRRFGHLGTIVMPPRASAVMGIVGLTA